MSRFATDADLLVLKADLYAATTPEERAFVLTESHCMFRVSKWGCHLLRGHLAYVCHWLRDILANKGNVGTGVIAGEITAMSEGPISVSFGSSGASDEKDSWLATTSDGKQYMSLRRIVGVACGLNVSASSCRTRRRRIRR